MNGKLHNMHNYELKVSLVTTSIMTEIDVALMQHVGKECVGGFITL